MFILWNGRVVDSQTISYFSSFRFEIGIKYGAESTVKNYVSIASDEKSDLPDRFSICSSLLVDYVNSEHNFLTMFKDNGSHWFTLDLAVTQRNLETMTETMKIYYKDPDSGKYANDMFQDTGILINPHSWYHICMGLDTVSGLLRIVVNSREVVNMEKEYFRNTKDWKSNSVKGKVLGTERIILKDTYLSSI